MKRGHLSSGVSLGSMMRANRVRDAMDQLRVMPGSALIAEKHHSKAKSKSRVVKSGKAQHHEG